MGKKVVVVVPPVSKTGSALLELSANSVLPVLPKTEKKMSRYQQLEQYRHGGPLDEDMTIHTRAKRF